MDQHRPEKAGGQPNGIRASQLANAPVLRPRTNIPHVRPSQLFRSVVGVVTVTARPQHSGRTGITVLAACYLSLFEGLPVRSECRSTQTASPSSIPSLSLSLSLWKSTSQNRTRGTHARICRTNMSVPRGRRLGPELPRRDPPPPSSASLRRAHVLQSYARPRRQRAGRPGGWQ